VSRGNRDRNSPHPPGCVWTVSVVVPAARPVTLKSVSVCGVFWWIEAMFGSAIATDRRPMYPCAAQVIRTV